MGGADGERGASIGGQQVGVAGGACEAQEEGLLVQAVDSVSVRTAAVPSRVLAALPRPAAAARGGHGRQAQEAILVQVLQQNRLQEDEKGNVLGPPCLFRVEMQNIIFKNSLRNHF